MTFLRDVMNKLQELANVYNHVFYISSPYPQTDTFRIRWLFLVKKAIREVIRENKPYAKPNHLTVVVALTSSAIMKLRKYPGLFTYFEEKIENEFNLAKNGW